MQASAHSLPFLLIAALLLGLGTGFLTRPSPPPADRNRSHPDAPIGKNPTPLVSSIGRSPLDDHNSPPQENPGTQSAETVLATATLDPEWNWVERIRNASPADMPQLLEQLKDHPDDETHLFLRRLLVAHWHDLDPAAAMAYARKPGNAPVFNDLYREWARKNMDAALASLEQLEGHHLAAAKKEISMAAAQTYNLPDFMEWTNRVEEGNIAGDAYRIAFERFAQNDLGSALTALDSVKWRGHETAVPAVAEVYADLDPAAALAWTKTLEAKYGNEALELAMAAVLKRYAEINPDILAREAIDLAGGKFWRGGLFARAANQLFENQSPEAAAEWMKTWLDPGGQRFQAGTLIANHAEHDFENALNLVNAMGPDFWENGGFFGLPKVSDPAKLLEQFDARANEIPAQAHSTIRDKLVNQWAAVDFDAAINYALAHIDPGERHAYTRELFKKATDPLDAWNRSNELPENLAAQVRRRALNDLVRADVDTANELFNQLPAGPERDQAAQVMMDRLSQFGPMPAWEWASQLEEGTVKAKAVRAITAVYAEGDPLGASQWINEMPRSESRDRAIMALTNKTTRDDPEGAFIWAAQIDNPTIKLQQLERALGRWGITNPGKAERAIQSLQLDAEPTNKLLQALSQARNQ